MRMLSWRKPSADSTRRFLTAQTGLDFSYKAVGATANELPPGFVVDRTRVKLGEGEAVFQAAKTALQQWRQFDLGWLHVWSPEEATLQKDGMVAIVAHAAGLWWLNACRIVYVVDESSGPIRRFGLAYGTLPEHAGRGEERFLIEWNQNDNSVWYEVLAFSRPNHFLARLGYPLVRRIQKRFGRDSAAAMLRAVRSADVEGDPARRTD